MGNIRLTRTRKHDLVSSIIHKVLVDCNRLVKDGYVPGKFDKAWMIQILESEYMEERYNWLVSGLSKHQIDTIFNDTISEIKFRKTLKK